jgi:hypothetical protein
VKRIELVVFVGAVGIGPFENDGAGDLCCKLQAVGRDSVVAVLGSVLVELAEAEPGEYIEKDCSEEAVAAAAVMVARIDGDSEVLREQELDALIPEIPAELMDLAVSALRRTISGDNDSELYDLWVEAGAGPAWKSGVELLIVRLESASAHRPVG